MQMMSALQDVKVDSYKEKLYWEKRYIHEDSNDWFCELKSFEHLLIKHVKQSDSILNLGCGNSTLSYSLYSNGYQCIDNIDFSESVIRRMREKHSDMTNMKWHVMDMLDLNAFGCDSFDVVIDKGSIDALMVDQGSMWEPKQEATERVQKALDEVHRVLKTGGRFISITFSQPHFRGPLLYIPDKYTWNVHHYEFGTSFHYYFYVANKKVNVKDVLSSQDFNYSYSFVRSAEHKEKEDVVYLELNEDEDFLLRIGDINSY